MEKVVAMGRSGADGPWVGWGGGTALNESQPFQGSQHPDEANVLKNATLAYRVLKQPPAVPWLER